MEAGAGDKTTDACYYGDLFFHAEGMTALSFHEGVTKLREERLGQSPSKTLAKPRL